MKIKKKLQLAALGLMLGITAVFGAPGSTSNAAETSLVYEDPEGEWQWSDPQGWWYKFEEGGYPTNAWLKLEDRWFYFNSEGYIVHGWQRIDGKWYYFHMVSGDWIDNNTYEEGTIKGIDVSKWQGVINWDKVKTSDINFTFVRVGHGNRVLDPYFKRNVTEANRVGIPVGVYYYSTAQTEYQARCDAKFVIKSLNGYKISYPVVIDMEDASQIHLGKDKITKIAKAFCDEIRAAGYTPMVYSNEYWYNNYLKPSMLKDIDFWIARYNNVHNPAIPKTIWQAGSNTRLPGINGNVDIDFGYKDYTKYIKPRTKAVSSYDINQGFWVSDSKGSWYCHADGSYTKNYWERIDGKKYYFDENGYMTIGWKKISGKWYYFKKNGLRARNTWVGKRYLDATGAWDKNVVWASEGTWIKNDTGWWYKYPDGTYPSNTWEEIDGFKYYFNADGYRVKGWLELDGNWYYLKSNGRMATGWLNKDNYWYYFDEETGVRAKGWKKIDGDKYYFYKKTGKMACNTTVGKYRVDEDGCRIVE